MTKYPGLHYGENVMKTGPIDPEVICLQESIKNKLTVAEK